MENTSYIALSRQMALQNKMTVVAGNIANMASTGFKAEHVNFDALITDADKAGDIGFVQDNGRTRDLSPGELSTTGNPLDIAIDGPGYLSVGTSQGVTYTRDGHLSLNSLGELVNADGDPVLDDGGAAIAIPAGSGAITIAADGTVSTELGIAGRLQLVNFADEQDMDRAGHNSFKTTQAAIPLENPQFVQGNLESSNVNAILEMTDMMETLRAFQETQKFIETQHDLTRRSVEQMLDTEA
ncbi:MAG: flagellar basal-body rod protein FlgF [Geminicoccaceae bacterium]|nr:flagellar basal-body rod protein FlgF [Geminicoccaceae bacterium]